MTDIDWSDFKLLLALSRGGSVAGAGRILGVDSSTVSRRLGQIEKTLGACLVVRGGREFTLTSEGKEAIAAAEAMEAIVTNAATSIRAAKTDIDGIVRISTVPSMLRTLMPLLPIAAEKYPKLAIEINAVTRTIDLAKGEADIALRMVQPTDISLIARRAIEMGFAVFASQAYASKHGLPKTPGDLGKHRLIQYVEPMLHLPWFGWLELHANKSAPVTRVDSTETAASLIGAGNGIGVLPTLNGDTSPELVRVFPEPIACAIGWIVYHETARNSARIRAAVDLLTEFLAERREELGGKTGKGIR